MADISFFDPNREAEIKRRRRLAEMTAQPVVDYNQQAGGMVVPVSPLAGLADALTKGVSAYQTTKADTMEAEDNAQRQQAMAQALSQLGTDPMAAAAAMMQIDPAVGAQIYTSANKKQDMTPQMQNFEYFNKLPPEQRGDAARFLLPKSGGGITVDPETGQLSVDTANRDLSSKEQAVYLENMATKLSTEESLKAMGQAKELASKGIAGFGATTRANLGANINSLLGRPESQSDTDTIKYDNFIQTQALPQLKALFGGNPTEGERKVLLDLQASANKTPAQRQAIIDNAMSLAQQRMSVANQMTQGLSSGEIYNQQPTQAQPAQTAPMSADLVRNSLRAKNIPEARIEAYIKSKGLQ